ncbi:MAG: 23S rRNA (pseudouridine(1915)-N(3))-methyltransferase RlmH [Patescibacteria group bacterium]|jgi:23S rRNA (pseudouridine1915-N3)-methyltransferase
MIHITFVSVGDLPKGPFSAIRDDFLKRLAPFVRLEHRIVSEEKTVEEIMSSSSTSILLDAAGKSFTSESLAARLKDFEDRGEHLTFILGGPKGFSPEIKKKATLLLSLSPMTTTHGLAHLFFLEQLYRACTINHGKIYHY